MPEQAVVATQEDQAAGTADDGTDDQAFEADELHQTRDEQETDVGGEGGDAGSVGPANPAEGRPHEGG